MDIKNLTDDEILALVDNRLDIITGDSFRGSGLSWESLNPQPVETNKTRENKIKLIEEMRELLGVYQTRLIDKLPIKKNIHECYTCCNYKDYNYNGIEGHCGYKNVKTFGRYVLRCHSDFDIKTLW